MLQLLAQLPIVVGVQVKLMSWLNQMITELTSRHFHGQQYPEQMLQLVQQQLGWLLADEQLQAFLTWVNQKSSTTPCSYKPAIVRAFYFELALARALGRTVGSTLELARAFDCYLTRNLESQLALDLALDRALGLHKVIGLVHNPCLANKQVLNRVSYHARTIEPMLALAMLQLKQQLPQYEDAAKFRQWSSVQGRAWRQQLRAVAIEYRNYGHNWQLSQQQQQTIQQYYEINCWLVNYLKRDRRVTLEVREQVERILLLPTSERKPLANLKHDLLMKSDCAGSNL